MGNTSKREVSDLRHEMALSIIGALPNGVRVIREEVITLSSNSEGNFTIQDPETRRILVQPQVGGSSGEVRIAPPNETATANSMPLLAGTRPFVLWVGEDDVISFFNDTGAQKVVTIWECR